jgi:hypothetical protein
MGPPELERQPSVMPECAGMSLERSPPIPPGGSVLGGAQDDLVAGRGPEDDRLDCRRPWTDVDR